MGESQAMCSCNRVERETVDNGDGTVFDKWVCAAGCGCGQEFMRRNMGTVTMPVKVPEWVRSDVTSICCVGPWKLRVTKETDEADGEMYWEVDITGPRAAEYLQYFDLETHSTREDAEWDAVTKVSGIADILEPLQRYL